MHSISLDNNTSRTMFVCCIPVYLSVKLKISVTTETIEVFSTGTGVILSFFLGRSGLLEAKGGVTVDKHKDLPKKLNMY